MALIWALWKYAPTNAFQSGYMAYSLPRKLWGNNETPFGVTTGVYEKKEGCALRRLGV
jgi:hypothetical protein